MYLLVSRPGERRWYGAPARGLVTIGSALEADIQLVGHNLAGRHVRLHFAAKGRVQIEVLKPYAVRLDGKPPRPLQELGGVLEIGPWSIALEPAPESGIEAIDEAFAGSLDDPDARLVYADALEERGRLCEAALMRGAPRAERLGLAVQTPPAWRTRFLPIAIEGCATTSCPGAWSALEEDGTCSACDRRVTLVAHLPTARELALRGRPVAVDPAVRRFPNDLREPVVKRPAIVMGQPRR